MNNMNRGKKLETGRFDIFLSKECISPCVGEGRRGARSSLACRVPTRQKSGFLEFKDLAPLLHCFPSPTAMKEELALASRPNIGPLNYGGALVFVKISRFRTIERHILPWKMAREYWVRPHVGLLSPVPCALAPSGDEPAENGECGCPLPPA